jgi:hypothetical protein
MHMQSLVDASTYNENPADSSRNVRYISRIRVCYVAIDTLKLRRHSGR